MIENDEILSDMTENQSINKWSEQEIPQEIEKIDDDLLEYVEKDEKSGFGEKDSYKNKVAEAEAEIWDKKMEAEQPVSKLDFENVHAFVPNKINLNYHGERIFVLGPLCYGMICRKDNNKLQVTYNINPDGVHPDYFTEIDAYSVPKRVYELLQMKLSTDIGRLDNMMTNIVNNKSVIGKLFNYVEGMKIKWSEWLEQAMPYTEEDAQKDKQIEILKARNHTSRLPQRKTKRSKAKAAKIKRKKTRRK